jgi:hypothetical protein
MLGWCREHPWVAVVALAGALATSMSCGSLHEFQGADSIVPVLVSLQKWTPFFWEQDRFGMLVPLITRPLRDPLMNLAAQGWVMTMAALLAPFVVARLLVEEAEHWVTAGALANSLLLLLPSDFVRFDWFIVQPYALSIATAAAALVLAGTRVRSAQLMGAALMLLAHWVNIGVVVAAVPLALARRESALRRLAVTACGAAAGLGLTRISPYHTTMALLPPSAWPRGWLELGARTREAFPNRAAMLAIALLAALATLTLALRCRREPSERSRLAAAIVAAVAAAMYWLVAGTSRWVHVNLYLPRYVYPSLLMCGVAGAIAFAAVLRGAPRMPVAAAALSCALTLFDYGLPSRGGLRARVDSRLGRLTPDVVASGATVIGGDYWLVWPAVFHANLTNHRRQAPAVYGLTYRSAPTQDLWKSRADIVLAAPRGDRSIVPQARRAGLAVVLLERRRTIDVYVTGKPD